MRPLAEIVRALFCTRHHVVRRTGTFQAARDTLRGAKEDVNRIRHVYQPVPMHFDGTVCSNDKTFCNKDHYYSDTLDSLLEREQKED